MLGTMPERGFGNEGRLPVRISKTKKFVFGYIPICVHASVVVEAKDIIVIVK